MTSRIGSIVPCRFMGFAWLWACAVWAIPASNPATAELLRLGNGTIDIGVDLNYGGSITYLAEEGGTNIVNNHDMGRQIQQSYYSGPSNYDPHNNQAPQWSPWPWNPIQTGDAYGHRATILESRLSENEIYVKTRPLQWALNNVPGEATFETRITLEGNAARVRCRLVSMRTDTTEQFSPRHQELPAVYTVGSLHRLVTYSGLYPFRGGATTELPRVAPPWQYWRATESWAALLNDKGWGLGVFHPGTTQFIGGFHGTPGSGGPYDDPTGYISPIQTEVIDHDIVYEYEYSLILGSLDDIRRWIYDRKPETRPDYRFAKDRQHWSSTRPDAGCPSDGFYRVLLEGNDPMLHGPTCAWRAEDVPTLYLSAAYHLAGGTAANAQLFWEINNEGVFRESQSVRFDVIPDGEFHTYRIDFDSFSTYKGLISRLRFDPVGRGQAGDYVDIRYISFRDVPEPCAGVMILGAVVWWATRVRFAGRSRRSRN